MKEKHFYLAGALLALVAMAVNHAVADDAARDWGSSMSFSSPSHTANAFNSALAIRNLRNGGGSGSSGGGATYNCKVAGACPSGGTVTQWNGVTVNSVTDSNEVTINNSVDAGSTQDAGVATCSQTSGCDIEFNP